jgi:hypothetical protein
MVLGKAIRRKAKKILERLGDAVPANASPGRMIQQKYPKPNKKKRRHSGRETPHSPYPVKMLEENLIFEEENYNEWVNYRDGFREGYKKEHKEKIKQQVGIRKAKRNRYSKTRIFL